VSLELSRRIWPARPSWASAARLDIAAVEMAVRYVRHVIDGHCGPGRCGPYRAGFLRCRGLGACRVPGLQSAAKSLLTRAQRDGSAERIAAARTRVDAAYTEADELGRAAIEEMQAMNAARLDNFGDLLGQMSRSWVVHDVALCLDREPGQ